MNYEFQLRQAYYAALNSPDPSTQNGAVLLSKAGHMIMNAWNDFPEGVDPKHWDDREAKYARVVHAETGVLIRAARHGLSTVDTTMLCPWAACSNCAKHIVFAGVKTLVRHEFSNNGVDTGSHWYADCLIGDEIMREGGVEIIEVPPITDTKIQLRRNGALWPAVLETA